MAKGKKQNASQQKGNKKVSESGNFKKILHLGRAFLILAILLASYLAYISLTNEAIPGCGGEKSCGLVLSSKYSKLLGIPVSLMGAGIYLCVILSTLPAVFKRVKEGSPLRFFLLVLMAMVPLAALWFGVVQLVLLKEFCPWCTGTHVAATVGTAFIFNWLRRQLQTQKPQKNMVRLPLLTGGLVACALTGATAALQYQAKEEDRSISGTSNRAAVEDASLLDPSKPRIITIHNKKHQFDVRSYPCIGSPNAENIMVAIVDHNCPYCSRLKRFLIDIVDYYGEEKVSLITLPGLGKDGSEETHVIMLSLWKEFPDVYKKISKDILDRNMRADTESIKKAAISALGGESALTTITEKHRQWAKDSIEAAKELNIENGKIAGKVSIPSLIIGEKVFVGAAPIPSKYFLHVADQFGLVAPPDVKQAFAKVGMDDNPYLTQAGVLEVAPANQQPVSLETYFKRTDQKIIYPEVNSTGFEPELFPMIGSPNAKEIAVVMSALSTDEGDKLLLDLIKTQKARGDDELGILFLPAATPKNAKSMYLTLFSVWAIRPELFEPHLMKLLQKEIPRGDAQLQAAMAPLIKPANIINVRKYDRQWLNLHLFSGLRTKKGVMLLDDAPTHPSDFIMLYKNGIHYGELPAELKLD